MKLKHFRAHKFQDVPDYIIEEINQTVKDLGAAITPIINQHNCNINLAAVSWLQACLMKEYVSEDPIEIKKAALLYAADLVQNIEKLTNVKVFDKETY